MKALTQEVVTTKKLFACPECGSLEHSYGHLTVGDSFGPWYCDSCGCSVLGRVTADSVDIERGKNRMAHALVLLRLDAVGASHIHIVVRGLALHEDGQEPVFGDSGMRYYYNQRTCPWNYLRLPIKEGEDTDPHGLFVFQEAVPMPEDYDDSLDDIEHWRELFPSLRENDQ